ncbi:MAG: hypothetical protein M3P70_09955 [Actinomycetota bacterium]|nr:hypothetical protein [Actinomycetota bacterium]
MRADPERLAWVVLRTANRAQAKGSTARIVVPRDPELADELGREWGSSPTDEDLLSAEEYLEEHGYLAPTDIVLTRGTYTITPAGLRWVEGAPPGAPETSRVAGEEPAGAGSRFAPKEDQVDSEPNTEVSDRWSGGGQGSRRPWWRRVFGRRGRI